MDCSEKLPQLSYNFVKKTKNNKKKPCTSDFLEFSAEL